MVIFFCWWKHFFASATTAAAEWISNVDALARARTQYRLWQSGEINNQPGRLRYYIAIAYWLYTHDSHIYADISIHSHSDMYLWKMLKVISQEEWTVIIIIMIVSYDYDHLAVDQWKIAHVCALYEIGFNNVIGCMYSAFTNYWIIS